MGSYCDYKCGYKHRLTQHEQTHTGEKPFKCPHCKYAAKQKGNLRNHIRVVHDGIKKYQCSHCDYKSGYKQDMKQHEQTHTGEKPFKCPHCEHATNQKSNLSKHIRRMHSQ